MARPRKDAAAAPTAVADSGLITKLATAGQAELEAIDAAIGELKAKRDAIDNEISGLRVIRKAIDYKLNGNPIANAKRRKKQAREAAGEVGDESEGDDDDEPAAAADEPAAAADEPAEDDADSSDDDELAEVRSAIRTLLFKRGPITQSDIRGATMLAMSEIVEALNHQDFKQLPNGRWALRQHGVSNTRKEAS